MSDEKVLTKEIAEDLLPKNHANFTVYTAIEDDAVEVLYKREGSLNFKCLTSLSDAAAESLSRHKGDLRLNGVTSLSDAVGCGACPS